MVEKTDSNTSIGFVGESESDIQLIKSSPPPYGDYLYNICVFAIKCQHNKMPLLLVKDKTAVWLPYVGISPGQKWIHSCEEMEEQFIKEYVTNEEQKVLVNKGFIESMKLVSVSRLQLPSEEFIERMIFCAKWKIDCGAKIVCCKNTDNFEWHSIDDVITGKVFKFWGKEVSEFGRLLNKSDVELKRSPIETKEIDNRNVYRFLSYDSKSEKKEDRIIAESLKATAVDRKVMEKLYSDFVQHCYPSFYMSFISYQQYMTRMQLKRINDQISERAFIAMNYETHKGFLTFDEFLLGLVALEPKSPQNDMRNAYIFRYYDSNSDGVLDREDIKQMINDMKTLQKKAINSNGIEEEVDRIINIPGIFDNKQNITFETLVSKSDCEELKLLSVLFRSLESLHKLITEQNLYEPIGKTSKILSKDVMSGVCPKHSNKDFKLAIHSVSMGRNGRLTDPKDIRNTDGKDIKFATENESVENQRRHSAEVTNNDKSLSNFVIESIRELVKILSKTDVSQQSKRDFKISTTEKLKFGIIDNICKEIQQIFRNESRVLKVQSPIFVLGDIHGNIKDLLSFEEMLWKTAPQCLPSNLLFAGDFVDRGEFSIECVLYLYSMKILNPNQVFLLRGNHEIRAVQKNFTFEKECNEKYKKNGPKIFELFNQTFDVLPVAAIIDETLFCAHGGIPYSLKTIDELMTVPTEIKDPETECPAVWEMLWSDPLNREDYENIIRFNKIKDDNGYINNTKRSTAFYFSEKALTAFLSSNRLTHVIRAHEVVDDGYKLFLNGKVITIFSSSGYCGLKNKAAAVQIDGNGSEGFLKIIILETKSK